MNGGNSNQRLGVSRNDAALQGATLAFHSRDPSPNVKAKPLSAMASDRHAPNRPRNGSDLGPEVGSVRDKIGRLTQPVSPSASTLNVRGRPSAASLASTSEIAARLAASRSPGRDTTTPSSAAKLGAIRSASRAPERDVPSPTPARSVRGRSSLDRMLLDDELDSDRDLPIPRRSPSQQSRTTEYHDSRGSSPHPSLSSRHSSQPDETAPRLPPRLPPSRGSIRSHGVPTTPLRPSTPSAMSISAQSHATSAPSIMDEPGMNEEALSNAIVASSLASARASPSIKVPPPLPPQRRRARSILHLAHSPKSDLSRTPSPPKGMPQTLRSAPKPDSDHRKHRNPLNKHPHKHHEGDRKHWRREVTEKERKRYEGVWASNKGLLIPTDNTLDGSNTGRQSAEMVLNLVVREIWSRSRLPSAMLEQVWDLVDHQNIGLLLREEFVVGMWLIDQQLKGHKLPVKVPDSVWDSVRHVAGIKLNRAH
ncbi:unnamed protein product [Penicillium salamii]|uniref:EH domain-containing protein n=1 Tax=Penicillium salamii TaxID=1612424 RepID=A0A9W4IH63_9EURO|nr:unnamed protein product [Penicillium salamii]CAG8032504.1 unnamed protein product [Penicillium salamii]CAG8168847.1 unnamed protein product [Penicillium salamii]CAG8201976.1 unnamed protein product [Penicillium salamii]CAG8210765.1 unnamed protein product [Penicillium salamii]